MPPTDSAERPVVICTRGSALALAQANRVRDDLAATFPKRQFELRIIKTTGDKLPSASLAGGGESLEKGLFTKELEAALLDRSADIAVHSLKDLPTELPPGLRLAATPPRADARDVLLYRAAAHADFAPDKRAPTDWSPGRREPFYGKSFVGLAGLPKGAVVATSSTRRAAVVKARRRDLEVVPIRGNVGTRLQKLHDSTEFDATLLAAAGLVRLHFDLGPRGQLRVDPRLPAGFRAGLTPPPAGLLATPLEPEDMVPAVGQGALALETRADDPEIAQLCAALNHFNTFQAVTAERVFLAAMGGGCQSPVGAYARVIGHQLHLRAASFHGETPRFAEALRPVREAVQLGEELAKQLR